MSDTLAVTPDAGIQAAINLVGDQIRDPSNPRLKR